MMKGKKQRCWYLLFRMQSENSLPKRVIGIIRTVQPGVGVDW